MREVYRWRVLAFIYIFMLVFAVTFQGIPPVLGFIVSSLGISHAQAGTLMSFFGLPGIFISIPGGILSDVYGSRYVGMVSLVITLVGSLLVGFGNSYFVLVAGRIISGIGALTIAISEGRSLKDAVLFANRAAAISVTRPGAQVSMPYRHEVDVANF